MTAVPVDLEHLDWLVSEGWLRTQTHPDLGLRLFNYTERTQYENHWTPETLMCRGLIVSHLGVIVARPFSKFFNYGTPQAADLPLHEPFTVTEKMDGSLGILYLDGKIPHVATRGSFTSEQAKVGTQMLREQEIIVDPGTTPLFEIIYPENRIVVDYGGRRELVLLGCIDNRTGLDAPLPQYSGTATLTVDSADLASLAASDRPNHEGYVVSFASGRRVKIKHAEYLRLHRIVTGVNARSVWDSLRQGDDMDALLEGVPDEIHAWITKTRDRLLNDYAWEEAKCEGVFKLRPEVGDRGELARYFKASWANPAVLFRMLDGKPYDDLIWKAVKPDATVPAFFGGAT